MVERVIAYRTEDGRLFHRKMEAVGHETHKRLTKFFTDNGCNEAQISKLVSKAGDLAMILEDLQKEIRKDMKERGG